MEYIYIYITTDYYLCSYVVGQAQRRDFSCHLFHTKRTNWAKPATSNAVVAACSATIPVSRRPFKYHRGNQVVALCNEIRFSSHIEGNCVALPSAGHNSNSMQREVKSIDFSTAGMYYCRLTRTALTLAVIASVPISGYLFIHVLHM